eukprot:GHVU01207734.1.p1 GENE.GHVU01207734.1~~GHVU01207734.1.p1  ORF type:complete len:126 (-),score=15.21 GHVU01207734.1:564-941(-)
MGVGDAQKEEEDGGRRQPDGADGAEEEESRWTRLYDLAQPPPAEQDDPLEERLNIKQQGRKLQSVFEVSGWVRVFVCARVLCLWALASVCVCVCVCARLSVCVCVCVRVVYLWVLACRLLLPVCV